MKKMSSTVFYMVLWEFLELLAVKVSHIKKDFHQLRATYRLRYQTRQSLRYLTARQLDDVGLTEADVRKEMAKFFWQE